METIYVEEAGDEECQMHNWCCYIDSNTGEMRYKECRKCWKKLMRLNDKTWKEIYHWTHC